MNSTSRYRLRSSAALVSQNAELAYCCITGMSHTPTVRFFSHIRDMKAWFDNFEPREQQFIHRYCANGRLFASSDTMFINELSAFIMAISMPVTSTTPPYTKVAFNATITFNLME